MKYKVIIEYESKNVIELTVDKGQSDKTTKKILLTAISMLDPPYNKISLDNVSDSGL